MGNSSDVFHICCISFCVRNFSSNFNHCHAYLQVLGKIMAYSKKQSDIIVLEKYEVYFTKKPIKLLH